MDVLGPYQIKDRTYYVQFALDELAYITNDGEITNAYALAIIQAKTVNPLDYAGNVTYFNGHIWNGASFTSYQILHILTVYMGYTENQFADMVNNENFHMYKAIYIMKRLKIWNYTSWNKKTGFVEAGEQFIPNIFGAVGKFFGDIIGGVAGGIIEGILGKNWKIKLAIIIIVIIVIFIGIIYFKYYLGRKTAKTVIKKVTG